MSPGARPARALALSLALTLLPRQAAAHSAFPGINDFYGGMLHPVLVPAHLLACVAAGLCLGQQRIQELLPALGAFLPALALGLVATVLGLEAELDALLLATTAIVGVAIALARRLPLPVKLAFVAVIGLALGLGSAPDAETTRATIASLFGTLLGASLVLIYATTLGDYLNRRDWTRVGTRVLGSWAAAAAIMVLALEIRAV